jgi:hypothetical protein
VALTALLMGCFKQSKRRVALFLEQVLNQPCSTGWVVKLQNQATAALTPAYEELAGQLPAEPVLGIDESPTKEARRKSWLWTFVASTYTVFALRTTRAALRRGLIRRRLLGHIRDHHFLNAVEAKLFVQPFLEAVLEPNESWIGEIGSTHSTHGLFDGLLHDFFLVMHGLEFCRVEILGQPQSDDELTAFELLVAGIDAVEFERSEHHFLVSLGRRSRVRPHTQGKEGRRVDGDQYRRYCQQILGAHELRPAGVGRCRRCSRLDGRRQLGP